MNHINLFNPMEILFLVKNSDNLLFFIFKIVQRFLMSTMDLENLVGIASSTAFKVSLPMVGINGNPNTNRMGLRGQAS